MSISAFGGGFISVSRLRIDPEWDYFVSYVESVLIKKGEGSSSIHVRHFGQVYIAVYVYKSSCI